MITEQLIHRRVIDAREVSLVHLAASGAVAHHTNLGGGLQVRLLAFCSSLLSLALLPDSEGVGCRTSAGVALILKNLGGGG